MVTTRFARLRRARDRHGPMVTTRFARLRRARDRHGLPGNFSLDRSKSASSGGSSSRPSGICDRSGNPAGMPGMAPSGFLPLGGVGPRPPFLAFFPALPLLALDFRVADLRPIPGMPMPPSIDDIILRASKK